MDSPGSRECRFCSIRRYSTEFIKPTEARKCCHEIEDTCQTCIRSTLSLLIAQKLTNNIQCPYCHEAWDRTTIASYASPEDFKKHDAYIATLPDFRSCPNSSSSSGQIHIKGEREPILKCHSCGFNSCFIHRVVWHSDMTCAEYEDRSRKTHLKKEVRISSPKASCPKCNGQMKKEDGWSRATCSDCKYQHCADCHADYEPILKHGNYRHRMGCKYYRASLLEMEYRGWD